MIIHTIRHGHWGQVCFLQFSDQMEYFAGCVVFYLTCDLRCAFFETTTGTGWCVFQREFSFLHQVRHISYINMFLRLVFHRMCSFKVIGKHVNNSYRCWSRHDMSKLRNHRADIYDDSTRVKR